MFNNIEDAILVHIPPFRHVHCDVTSHSCGGIKYDPNTSIQIVSNRIDVSVRTKGAEPEKCIEEAIIRARLRLQELEKDALFVTEGSITEAVILVPKYNGISFNLCMFGKVCDVRIQANLGIYTRVK